MSYFILIEKAIEALFYRLMRLFIRITATQKYNVDLIIQID